MKKPIEIKTSQREVILRPPVKGCNLTTVRVGDAYHLHVFTHASGHCSVSIHPSKDADKSHIDIQGDLKLKKTAVFSEMGHWDYTTIETEAGR